MKRWLLALVIVGGAPATVGACAGAQSRPERYECSEARLGVITAECNLRRETECRNLSDEDCPAVAECDKQVEEWKKCQ